MTRRRCWEPPPRLSSALRSVLCCQLQKFRKRTTKTVQVLTHIKEKVHHFKGINQELKTELDTLDAQMSKQRGTLSSAKGLRERLRAHTERLKGQRGFSSNPALAQDYERRKQKMEEMKDEIERLKERLRMLNLR